MVLKLFSGMVQVLSIMLEIYFSLLGLYEISRITLWFKMDVVSFAYIRKKNTIIYIIRQYVKIEIIQWIVNYII